MVMTVNLFLAFVEKSANVDKAMVFRKDMESWLDKHRCDYDGITYRATINLRDFKIFVSRKVTNEMFGVIRDVVDRWIAVNGEMLVVDDGALGVAAVAPSISPESVGFTPLEPKDLPSLSSGGKCPELSAEFKEKFRLEEESREKKDISEVVKVCVESGYDIEKIVYAVCSDILKKHDMCARNGKFKVADGKQPIVSTLAPSSDVIAFCSKLQRNEPLTKNNDKYTFLESKLLYPVDILAKVESKAEEKAKKKAKRIEYDSEEEPEK